MINTIYKLLISTIPYIIFGGISYIYFGKINNSLSIGRKKFVFIYEIVAITSICLLAGIRSRTVGTDVLVYAEPFYKNASYYGLFEYLTIKTDAIIFALLAHISYHVFGSFHVFLFLIEFCIVVPVYLFFKRERENVPIQYGMLCYVLIFFPLGLNVMRQSMAAALILLSVSFLKENCYVFFIITCFLSLLMHPSSIIGIILIVICYVFNNIKNKQKRILFYVVVSLVLSLILKGWASLVRWLIFSVHVLPERYSYYLTVYSGNAIGKGSYFVLGIYDFVYLIYKLCFTLLSIRIIDKTMSDLRNKVFYQNISYITFTIYVMCTYVFHTSYTYRITLFTDYVQMFVLAKCFAVPHKSTFPCVSKKKLSAFIFLLSYFFVIYFLFGAHGTVPYYIELF